MGVSNFDVTTYNSQGRIKQVEYAMKAMNHGPTTIGVRLTKLMEDICDLALKFSEEKYNDKIYSRPFGVSILIAAYYKNKPVLYNMDPSGSYLEYKAMAIGSAHEVVEKILQDEYSNFTDRNMTIKKAIDILRGVVKDKINEKNIEISIIDQAGIKNLNPEEILSYIE